MQLRETIRSGVALLTLSGNITSETDASMIREKIESLRSDNVLKIVVDLERVNHINSLGLGIFLASKDRVRQAGGDVKLANVGKGVQHLLSTVQLVKHFDTYETVDRAISSF